MNAITYYRDDTVEVTSRAVHIGRRQYPLRELATVWHRAGAHDSAGRRMLFTRPVYAIAPLAPLIAAAGMVALALRADLQPVHRITVVVVAGMVALLTVPLLDLVLGRVERSYDRGARVHEIWARWRGTEVLLVSTADRLRFGRIYRALQRAIESAS